MGPGHGVGAPMMVLHWFSLARSPVGDVPRSGFWLGRLLRSGAVSPLGGYAPGMPGAAVALGAKNDPSSAESKTALEMPRLQALPVKAGQLAVASLRTGPVTVMLPASPNGPPQPLFGGAAYTL